ncbi:hypothetical protein DsansV1_C09g0094121 [Dioscorea sansibarensis]
MYDYIMPASTGYIDRKSAVFLGQGRSMGCLHVEGLGFFIRGGIFHSVLFKLK